MSHLTKLSKEECVEVARRKNAGATLMQLATDYHVSQFTISNAIKRAELVTFPVLNGRIERAKILKKMSRDFCGGCGQEGLCRLIEQLDPNYQPFMWLCQICVESGVWQQ